MKHQQPCNRSAACAALEFAIRSPLSPDLGGGIRSPFNPHLTVQSAPAEGSLPLDGFTGLLPCEVALRIADNGLSRFAVIPQLGIALPCRSLARYAPRRIRFPNPAGSYWRLRQAPLQLDKSLPVSETMQQRSTLAVESHLCDARFNLNLEEPRLRRWVQNRASPSAH